MNANLITAWVLKLNHLIFWWYYKRCGEHFQQWTFIKSVKLLISNYEHDKLFSKNAHNSLMSAIKEIDELRSENSNLRIQQIATDGQIRWANKNFGTDWTPPTEN